MMKDSHSMRVCIYILMICALSILSILSGCVVEPTPIKPTHADPKATPIPADKNELMQIFAKQEDAHYRVRYSVITNLRGIEKRSELTKYALGTDAARFDIDGDTTTRIIRRADKSYTCSEADERWTCTLSPYEVTDQQEIELDAQENIDAYVVERTSARTIVGVNARCYKITTLTGWVEYCFSPDHIPLTIATSTDAGTTKVIAEEYALDVTLVDFDIPSDALARSAGTSAATPASLPDVIIE